MMTFWKACIPIHIILFCATTTEQKKTSGKSDAGVKAEWIQSSPLTIDNFKPNDEFEWDFVDLPTSTPSEAATKNSNHQKYSSTEPHTTTVPNRFLLADPGLSLVWNAPPYLEGYPVIPVGRTLQAVSPEHPKRKQGTRYEAKTKISLSEYESHEDESTEQPTEVENDDEAEYNDSVEDLELITTPSSVQTTSIESTQSTVKSASAGKLTSAATASTLSKKAAAKTSTSTKRTTSATTLTPTTPTPKALNRIPIIRKPVAIIRDQTKHVRQQVETITKTTKKMRARGRVAKQQTLSTRKPTVQKKVLYQPESADEKIINQPNSEAEDIDWENTPLKVPQNDFGMRIHK